MEQCIKEQSEKIYHSEAEVRTQSELYVTPDFLSL